ncbi:MAG: hypothetical protein LZF60_370030 [Nitrospira sp.]|nr:MAG: hypothetical protein LZF60_370030 [Nitrospira sp.]
MPRGRLGQAAPHGPPDRSILIGDGSLSPNSGSSRPEPQLEPLPHKHRGSRGHYRVMRLAPELVAKTALEGAARERYRGSLPVCVRGMMLRPEAFT